MRVSLTSCILASFWALSIASAQNAGLPPEWEVKKNMDALAGQVQRCKPILDEVKPEEWVAKGAPQAYQRQWTAAGAEIEYLTRATSELTQEPERLSLALETLFRMQSLDSMLGSIEDGVRKYQNPALADLLRGAMSDAAGQREKLRQYILQLAAVKEQEFNVINKEAQRCRAVLSRQPEKEQPPEKKAEPK